MRGPIDRLSLQTKLLISFIVVIVLATTIGYLFINHSVKRAFSDFTVRSFTIQDQILLELIISYYRRTGSFDRVIEILKESPREVPVLLIDPDGKVVYSPDERGRLEVRPLQGQPGEGVPRRGIPQGDAAGARPRRMGSGGGRDHHLPVPPPSHDAAVAKARSSGEKDRSRKARRTGRDKDIG